VTHILLVGDDETLLEGLAQSLSAVGNRPIVAGSLADARELAMQHPPLVAVVDGELAATSASEVLAVPLAPGGALVLYRGMGVGRRPLSPMLHCAVLADLMLPLERNRLVALIQHVHRRVQLTGRSRTTPPEMRP
jgi:DNA-binding NtrC family response regulator